MESQTIPVTQDVSGLALRPDCITDKRLKRLFEDGDESGIHAVWRGKVKRILNALDVAVHEMELPAIPYNPHPLKGNRKGCFSVSVSPNWRITYRWRDDGPYEVRLEDYHGR